MGGPVDYRRLDPDHEQALILSWLTDYWREELNNGLINRELSLEPLL